MSKFKYIVGNSDDINLKLLDEVDTNIKSLNKDINSTKSSINDLHDKVTKIYILVIILGIMNLFIISYLIISSIFDNHSNNKELPNYKVNSSSYTK